jgi:hypothetical protein
MDRNCKPIRGAVEVVERYEELLGEKSYQDKRRNMVRQVGVDRRKESTEKMEVITIKGILVALI